MADLVVDENLPESNRNSEVEEIVDKDVTKPEEVVEKIKDIEDGKEEQGRPDGGWGWMVCLGAFITNFVVFGTHNSFGVIYGTLIKELGISSAETAWIGSMGMGLNFFFGPISSALCERIGCRLTALTGSVLAVSGLLLSSFITRKDVSKMYATYGVMWGVGSSFCYVPSMVILGQYFDKRMALANGLGTSGSGFGTLIIAPIIQKLLTSLGWRATFRFLSGTASLLFIAAWLFKPLDGQRSKNNESAHPCVDLNIWRNKAFIVWVLSISFFLFGYFIPYVHLVRLATLHGVSGNKAAWLIGYLSIASTIGRVVFGKIGDLKQVNRLVMFQASILIIGASTALLSLANGYLSLVFYAITFGFFDGCFVGQVAVATSHIVGLKHLAVALGYLFGAIALPMTLGPPVAGWIYDSSQSYNVAFYVAGGTSFIGFLTMFFIPRLVKKYADDWEKQFDSKRRASIESRRKLLSNTCDDYGVGTDLARNSQMYEIDVFPAENDDATSGVPLTQISVERPANFGRGRRRSLPALYISNNPSPQFRERNLSEKARGSPGGQKIARISTELGAVTKLLEGDDRAGPRVSSQAAGSGVAVEKPRPNRMRGRRGSLPAIQLKSNPYGNVLPADHKAPRVAQVLLVDAHLLAQNGIPLVSVGAPSKINRNKRRGSLPAVNYPNLATAPKPASRPRPSELGRRRGSLPSIILSIPEATRGDSPNNEESPSNSHPERRRLTKPSLLTLPSRMSKEVSIEEQEEEGQEAINGGNLGADKKRLSVEEVPGSVGSSFGMDEKQNS